MWVLGRYQNPAAKENTRKIQASILTNFPSNVVSTNNGINNALFLDKHNSMNEFLIGPNNTNRTHNETRNTTQASRSDDLPTHMSKNKLVWQQYPHPIMEFHNTATPGSPYQLHSHMLFLPSTSPEEVLLMIRTYLASKSEIICCAHQCM